MTQAKPGPSETGPRAPRRRGHRFCEPAEGRSTLLAGRYRLEERVGRGGMADVWRAHDTRLDRTVAVKILHPHLLPDETSRSRFVAEARAAARLAHPGIVPVYDVLEDGDTTAIIFQFVPGESLADRLAREGPLPPEVAAALAGDVAEALEHAHRAGVIHRDVKPANVVLDGDGRARLVDFGIARVLNEAAARLTADGDAVGTLRYMAPEQLRGAAVDERTDLFGLGLVLVEMLTGRPAFAATSPVGLLEAQRDGPPELPDVSPDLRSLAERLLAFDPEARPRSAREVVEAIGQVRPGPEVAPSTLRVVSGVADPTAAAGARMSGQSEATAVIPIVEPATIAGGSGHWAPPAGNGALERPGADHPDAIASLMTAASSAGATARASLRSLGRWVTPSFGSPVTDGAPDEEFDTTGPGSGGRARRLRAVGVPALLAIALLAAVGIVALGAGRSLLSTSESTIPDEGGGALVASTPMTEATPSQTAEPQPADAGGGSSNGKAKGKGKGGR